LVLVPIINTVLLLSAPLLLVSPVLYHCVQAAAYRHGQ
jgi:hypothetical protein